MSTQALRANTAQVIKIDIARRLRKQAPAGFFIPDNVQSRIDALTDKTAGRTAIWRWKGSVMQANGYPQISFEDQETGKRATMCVHRVLMSLKQGRRLARTEYVLHARGIPSTSVNPKHLRIGTQLENIADAKADKRLRRNLRDAEVLRIVRLSQKDGCDPRDIAHTCKVSTVTVANILRGRTHSKLTGIPRHRGIGGRPRKVKNGRTA